jgi:hypothetical protein
MYGLCKYKNIFGEPSTGVHRYRIFNIAVVDVVFTLLFAAIFSKWFNISFLYLSIGLFVLGIALHRTFCVRTTIDRAMFPNAS